MSKRKHILVLSGGGFRGAFQLGAINYLKQNWHKVDPDNPVMKFDLIAGVSVGALNGSLLAMDKLDILNNLWDEVADNGVKEIYTSDIIDTSSKEDEVQFKFDFERLKKKLIPNFELKLSIGNIWRFLFSRKKFIAELMSKLKAELEENLPNFKSVAGYQPMFKKLKKNLKQADFKSRFICGLVSLDDGSYYGIPHDEFENDNELVKGVLASAAMPIIWEPVPEIKFSGKTIRNSIDGGIKNVSPLGDVINYINQQDDNSDEYIITIINCSSGEVIPKPMAEANIGAIALRSLVDISNSEIFDNDIRQFIRVNQIVKQVKDQDPSIAITDANKPHKKLKCFNAIIIQPDNNVLGDFLTANRKLVDRRMQHGEDKTKAALEKLNHEVENFGAIVA